MKRIADLRFLIADWVGVALALCCVAADWQKAEPGWQFEFPRDHGSHPNFKTEWWYFTGNVEAENGRRFGYQLTFFRHGVRPRSGALQAAAEGEETGRPGGRPSLALSRFIVDDLKFAHFTITDAAGKRFHFDQKISRGAFGEAGFENGERVAWIDNWTLRLDGDGLFTIEAAMDEAALKLRLVSEKPPVLHGESGFSRKAEGEGHASNYYSLTRLTTSGEVRVGERTFAVRGLSWFDHEWATNQLAPGQIGWDWLSVQLGDGTELMLYQIRLENGGADPSSSGTFVAADGAVTHLPGGSYRMTPIDWWKSGKTPARYPIAWRVEIPGQQVQLAVRAVIPEQELALRPLSYWEGAVDVSGTRNGKEISGRGYLELTGYSGPLRELSR